MQLLCVSPTDFKQQIRMRICFNGCGAIWLWLKIKELGLRRCWSMFPLTRVPFWYRFFEPQLFVFFWCRSFWEPRISPQIHQPTGLLSKVASLFDMSCCGGTLWNCLRNPIWGTWVTLKWWFELAVSDIEPLLLVEGKWETTP